MMKLVSEEELYHHGIKGQKWGVRRYQNEDGTYTDQGKERYGVNSSGGKTFSGRQEKKNFDFRNLTPEQKERIKKGAMIVGGALLVGGAIYCVSKSGILDNKVGFPGSSKLINSKKPLIEALENYPSKSVTLSKGQKLQRVSSEAAEDYSKRGETYCSYMFGDNQTYKSQFSNTKYVHELTLNQDLKAPSVKETAEIFSKIDPKAKEGGFHFFMNSAFMNTYAGDNFGDDPAGRFLSQNKKKFVEEVKSRGYNAIIDLNDYGDVARSPLIIFDPGSMISSDKSHQLGTVERVFAQTIEKPWRQHFV